VLPLSPSSAGVILKGSEVLYIMASASVYPTIAHPYRVTAPDGKVHLVVMHANDGLPAAFALMGTRATNRVGLRIGGGCKGMNATDKLEMLDYFATALEGYEGLVWSGGSRALKDGEVDPMITEVPGVIANENPGCVALASVPRIDLLTLRGDSRLVLDEWNVPNPAVSAILIVQNGADGKGDWDGDVDVAFRLMDNWINYAGFTAMGEIAWNGGDITKDEVIRAAKRGWPSIVINGSGRAADEIAAKIASGNTTLDGLVPANSISVAQRNNPQTLRALLSKFFRTQTASA